MGATHSICNLKYILSKKTFIVFLNGCNHDYHFIIKEPPKEFEELQFTLREEILDICVIWAFAN